MCNPLGQLALTEVFGLMFGLMPYLSDIFFHPSDDYLMDLMGIIFLVISLLQSTLGLCRQMTLGLFQHFFLS